MKKTNWLIKHTLTVFSCVLIIALGIAFLTHADLVTTTIGENISTNDLSVTGNITSGTWQGTAITDDYIASSANWNTAYGWGDWSGQGFITVASPSQGDILYYNGSSWIKLGHGIDGQFLMTHGADADPVWSGDIFVCGTSTVTFKYRGGSVTYGTVAHINECWLDRNLGASQIATSSTNSAAYGDLFQWGRLSDNHEDRTSGTTTTNSSIDNPYHSNFITESFSPYDWRVPQKDGLWQGVNGINNPCPDGWRIPTETEWNTERTSWGSNNSAGAFASPLKLTVAGYRKYNNGSLGHVGDEGGNWSSTVNGTPARHLLFFSNSALMSDTYRVNGRSIRCIRD